MKTLNTVAIILLAAVSGAAGTARAQPPADQPPAEQPPTGQHHRHHPPPEALEACKSATSGQQCSFTSPHGDQISGTCIAHEGRPLACRPSHPPGGDQPGAQPPKP